MDLNTKKPVPKPYTPPVLSTFGNIAKLTNAVGNMGGKDGGSGGVTMNSLA